MALNPDALNLNYDSDDSMQVDSDSDNPVHHPSNNHLLPPNTDTSPDADADPDADAEGDAEYVDDTTSAILENPVAGPSSYSHKEYVSLLFLTHPVLIYDILPRTQKTRQVVSSHLTPLSVLTPHPLLGLRRPCRRRR